mmetsp:Transcript_28777/g.73308  ORF Transcript_28777/g.73308 Transcript_28777/m.73308 type:complete len:276 (+) Transcript_28777:1486-2313(+)
MRPGPYLSKRACSSVAMCAPLTGSCMPQRNSMRLGSRRSASSSAPCHTYLYRLLSFMYRTSLCRILSPPCCCTPMYIWSSIFLSQGCLGENFCVMVASRVVRPMSAAAAHPAPLRASMRSTPRGRYRSTNTEPLSHSTLPSSTPPRWSLGSRPSSSWHTDTEKSCTTRCVRDTPYLSHTATTRLACCCTLKRAWPMPLSLLPYPSRSMNSRRMPSWASRLVPAPAAAATAPPSLLPDFAPAAAAAAGAPLVAAAAGWVSLVRHSSRGAKSKLLVG